MEISMETYQAISRITSDEPRHFYLQELIYMPLGIVTVEVLFFAFN